MRCIQATFFYASWASRAKPTNAPDRGIVGNNGPKRPNRPKPAAYKPAQGPRTIKDALQPVFYAELIK